VLEAYSLRVAFKSIQRSAEEQGMGVWQYVKRGRDPTTVAILWEDGGAVAGLGLAGAASASSWPHVSHGIAYVSI
jgi:zinc transporter 9